MQDNSGHIPPRDQNLNKALLIISAPTILHQIAANFVDIILGLDLNSVIMLNSDKAAREVMVRSE